MPLDATQKKTDVPSGVWMRCSHCESMMYRKLVAENLHVCPECRFHFRIDAATRIEQLTDPNSFEEFAVDLTTTDPLGFKWSAGGEAMTYKARVKKEAARTGSPDAIRVGRAFIRARPVVLGVMDSSFLMASMGAVVGEKVTRAAERAVEENRPLVMVTASGGARMHEGTVSLVQMAKTSAAIARLRESGGLYIVVMTDPTTAGVAASFAFLGDVHLAEPGALIGFTGPRVIANTIRQTLPDGFQRAEFLLEHGFIDRIVNRRDLRSEIARLIDYCGK